MSRLIRKYRSKNLGGGCDDMCVTAYVGEGRAVQFTIGSQYCALSEAAVWDLMETLRRRLSAENGYTAIGEEREDAMFEEGVNNNE